MTASTLLPAGLAVLLTLTACDAGKVTSPDGASTGGGPVRVSVAVVGGGTDPDGFTLDAGETTVLVGAGETRTLSAPWFAGFTVTLTGVAPHCTSVPRSHTVLLRPAAEGGPTQASVTFSVFCLRAQPTGRLAWEQPDGVWSGDVADMANARLVAAGAEAPAFASDGRVAFVAGPSGARAVHVATASGNEVVRLDPGVGATAARPAWSPDGTRLAYVATEGGSAAIRVVTLATGETVELAAGAAGDTDWPAWSPDGATIAFSRRSGERSAVMAIGLDGTGLREIGAGTMPAWSPDGVRIALVEERCVTSPRCDRYLVLMHADGSSRRDVRRGADLDRPAWSPDGGFLVYGSDGRLWVIQAAPLSTGLDVHAGLDLNRSGRLPTWR